MSDAADVLDEPQADVPPVRHEGRPIESRWLRRYRALVTNASSGAVLRDPEGEGGGPAGGRQDEHEHVHEHGEGRRA